MIYTLYISKDIKETNMVLRAELNAQQQQVTVPPKKKAPAKPAPTKNIPVGKKKETTQKKEQTGDALTRINQAFEKNFLAGCIQLMKEAFIGPPADAPESEKIAYKAATTYVQTNNKLMFGSH